eukprot:CAMPEP_0194210806 /NCGR_PEP_ID=MMETSP0156-20130528/9117_1 /TAXON_ID=33649 /ORGANISM="Thalassionema nitzschioides, Strain L26-B" /LENGTH=547 /DNA_ID=CAMNT_0038938209 /DNA_START=36 /DNA_END=1679 /DNA_ORIENTATION=+
MHRHDQQMLSSLALLCVFLMVALFASNSVELSAGLRRRSEALPKSADEVAAEYARLAASSEQLIAASPVKSNAVTSLDELPTSADEKATHTEDSAVASKENQVSVEEQSIPEEPITAQQEPAAEQQTQAEAAQQETSVTEDSAVASKENQVSLEQQSSPEEPITAQQEPTAEQPPQAEAAQQETSVTTSQLQAVASAVEETEGELQMIGILSKLHQDMCSDDWANAPPLPYERCNATGIVNGIPLFGGLTNALKLILLGAIGSFEENRCFFVDESNSKLNPEDENGVKHGFLHKYMEPIGLSLDHPIVVKAQEEYRTKTLVWMESWQDMSARRAAGQYSNIPNLGVTEVEGHNLKRNLIRRLWRPLPKYRKSSCSAMEKTHGLKPGDYMAFSVRRGDKTEEDYSYTPLHLYIIEAEKHLHRFGSYAKNRVVPKIFVATDDCSVLSEFRKMRPTWKFTSECDIEENSKAAGKNGFALADVKDWGEDAEDAHFTKFFTEIYSMTMARVFIGVSYTNISWWVYFLRLFRHSFILLDKPEGEPDSYIYDNW